LNRDELRRPPDYVAPEWTISSRDAEHIDWPAAPIEVGGEYKPLLALPSVADLENLAVAHRPELSGATAGIDEGESALKLARKAYTPDYTASAGYMLMPETSRVRNTYMAEFSLNLPWLNRRRHNSEIDEAQAKLDTAQAQYELQRSIVCESDKERRCGVRGARVDWALSATCRRQAMLPPIARFYAARGAHRDAATSSIRQ